MRTMDWKAIQRRHDGFAERLREARVMRRMTQSELARVAQLHVAAVSHFETGTRKPSLYNLIVLSAALDTSFDFLLGLIRNLEGD